MNRSRFTSEWQGDKWFGGFLQSVFDRLHRWPSHQPAAGGRGGYVWDSRRSVDFTTTRVLIIHVYAVSVVVNVNVTVSVVNVNVNVNVSVMLMFMLPFVAVVVVDGVAVVVAAVLDVASAAAVAVVALYLVVVVLLCSAAHCCKRCFYILFNAIEHAQGSRVLFTGVIYRSYRYLVLYLPGTLGYFLCADIAEKVHYGARTGVYLCTGCAQCKMRAD